MKKRIVKVSFSGRNAVRYSLDCNLQLESYARTQFWQMRSAYLMLNSNTPIPATCEITLEGGQKYHYVPSIQSWVSHPSEGLEALAGLGYASMLFLPVYEKQDGEQIMCFPFLQTEPIVTASLIKHFGEQEFKLLGVYLGEGITDETKTYKPNQNV